MNEACKIRSLSLQASFLFSRICLLALGRFQMSRPEPSANARSWQRRQTLSHPAIAARVGGVLLELAAATPVETWVALETLSVLEKKFP